MQVSLWWPNRRPIAPSPKGNLLYTAGGISGGILIPDAGSPHGEVKILLADR
jgi:hypothetical protein